MTNRTPLRDILDTYRDRPPTRDELEQHVVWADENLMPMERRDILDSICADMTVAIRHYAEGHHADARRAVARIEVDYRDAFDPTITAMEADRHADTEALDERGLADLITRKGA